MIRTRKDPGRSATLSGYTRLGKLIAGSGERLPFIRWPPQFRFRTFCLLRDEPTGDDARSRLCAICRVRQGHRDTGTQGHRKGGRTGRERALGTEHRATPYCTTNLVYTLLAFVDEKREPSTVSDVHQAGTHCTCFCCNGPSLGLSTCPKRKLPDWV